MNKKALHIEVLGSGCPTCKKLHDMTVQAVEELKLGVDVAYSNDIQKMLDLGVMSSPVLAIDGDVVIRGFVPSYEKIKEVISNKIQ